jgi:hypothetical protein
LLNISTYSSLFPIVFYFLFLKRNKGRKLWFIPLTSAASLITDLILAWARDQSPPNRGVTYLTSTMYTLIEGALFVIFLYSVLKTSSFRYILLVLAALNFAYGVGSLVTEPDLSVDYFNLKFAAVEEASIILLCIFYYYEQLNNPAVTFIYELKEFWPVTAFFFVTVSTLFLFIASSILGSMGGFWSISQTALTIKSALLVVGLLRRPTIK